MSRKRRLFWTLFAGLVVALSLGALLLLLGIHVAYNSFTVPTSQTSTSSGPQAAPPTPVGFTFLALVVAFSVYLRQVASGADEKRDKILKGDVSLYSPSGPNTKEKLDALNQTHENLTVIAPFLIWLTLFVTCRVFLEGIVPFGFQWVQRFIPFIRVFDFLLLEWLALMFVVLALFHLKASRRDERLRNVALAGQQSEIARQTERQIEIRVLEQIKNVVSDGHIASDRKEMQKWLIDRIAILRKQA